MRPLTKVEKKRQNQIKIQAIEELIDAGYIALAKTDVRNALKSHIDKLKNEVKRKIEENEKCEHQECENKATEMVFSRDKGKVVFCCDVHGDAVVDEGLPEYWESCPNCDCRFGVN